ncbi:MAG: hypothetical protein AABZ53_03450, partial [Planctomycetota bacterium]
SERRWIRCWTRFGVLPRRQVRLGLPIGDRSLFPSLPVIPRAVVPYPAITLLPIAADWYPIPRSVAPSQPAFNSDFRGALTVTDR